MQKRICVGEFLDMTRGKFFTVGCPDGDGVRVDMRKARFSYDVDFEEITFLSVDEKDHVTSELSIKADEIDCILYDEKYNDFTFILLVDIADIEVKEIEV